MSGVSLMLLLFLFISNCASGDKIFSTDVWNITYDDQQGGIALTYKSKNICNPECMLPINGKEGNQDD